MLLVSDSFGTAVCHWLIFLAHVQAKATEGRLTVVDSLAVDPPKTVCILLHS